jgi:hypothetical protein
MSWREQTFPRPIQYSPETPEKLKILGISETRKTFVAPLPDAPAPSAVLVFHGMGQQVRFETLSDLASAILDEAEARKGTVTDLHIGIAPRADTPGQFLARAEIAWTDKDGAGHAAHVYEAYWAPLTEGKVTYWETIEFLLEGGCNGLKSILTPKYWSFDRWVFGGFRPMAITKGTPIGLLLVVFVLLFTVAIIAMAGAAVAEIVKKINSPNPSDAIKVVVETIYGQIEGPWNYLTSWVAGWFHSSAASVHLPDPAANAHIGLCWYLFAVVVWGVLVGLVFFIRYFIVAYVGAVAGYLSPYKDSKFEELREAVQKVGMDAARLIYYGSKPTPGAADAAPKIAEAEWIPDYQNIVFVSHSLGTVLAYDTLNAIFNLENTSNPPPVGPPGANNRAVERTRALITFGSPLDKTAFIYRAQFNRDTQIGRIREEMACAIQPLITDYSFRFDQKRTPHGPRWINLWSPKDIISGELIYFDYKKQAPSRDSLVCNIPDPACTIPLYAHVQYWGGELLRKTVYDQLI